MRTNHYTKITPYDVAKLFNLAYGRVTNIKKGISGFKRTGIYPFNPDAYTCHEMHVAVPPTPVVDVEMAEEHMCYDDGAALPFASVANIPQTIFSFNFVDFA